MTLKEAQKVVKSFAEKNQWKDVPNIDKFDHLHEELIEMSRHLRYKSEVERIKFVEENRNMFTSEMGDLLFGLCRLANQLGVDLEDGFMQTQEKVFKKYDQKGNETNIVRQGEPV